MVCRPLNPLRGREGGSVPARVFLTIALVACLLWGLLPPVVHAGSPLPAEPDESTRVDEVLDNESRLYLILYSLKGDGKVDYVTGRRILEQIRNEFDNPVYSTARFPFFYWWNHILWVDQEQDGVNGNEVVYQENIDFDRTRYKPCLFNGQPC
jgi:hypothetical protein